MPSTYLLSQFYSNRCRPLYRAGSLTDGQEKFTNLSSITGALLSVAAQRRRGKRHRGRFLLYIWDGLQAANEPIKYTFMVSRPVSTQDLDLIVRCYCVIYTASLEKERSTLSAASPSPTGLFLFFLETRE